MKKNSSFFLVLAVVLAFMVSSTSPALAQGKTFKWRLQSVDDTGLMEYKEISNRFADRVRELSNGRLDIKVFPPGGLVSTFDVYDAVRKGMFEMSQTFMVYFSGKEPALKAINEWAVMRDPLQAGIWYYQRGGLKLMDDILGKHGLTYLGATPLMGEHFWSKVPLRTVADVKGKKMRASGLAADMAATLGASVVTVPGGEVYSALERGVIDFCEFTTQTVNYGLGFHEVTKYIVFPSYSGGGSYDWFANRKAWNSLPDDLKKIFIVALNETSFLYYSKVKLETELVNEKLRKHGMTFITWSEKDMEVVEKARIAALEKYAAASSDFARVFKSRMELLRELGYKH